MSSTEVTYEFLEEAKSLDQTNANADDLEMAISFAVHAHAGQRYLFGAPYILQPLRVMQRIFEMTEDYYLSVIAVLHDTVKDTATTLDEIEEIFGVNIRMDVDALTQRDGEDYLVFMLRCSKNIRAARVRLLEIAENEMLGIAHPLPMERQQTLNSQMGAEKQVLEEAVLLAAKPAWVRPRP